MRFFPLICFLIMVQPVQADTDYKCLNLCMKENKYSPAACMMSCSDYKQKALENAAQKATSTSKPREHKEFSPLSTNDRLMLGPKVRKLEKPSLDYQCQAECYKSGMQTATCQKNCTKTTMRLP